jgi:hypothetical protein
MAWVSPAFDRKYSYLKPYERQLRKLTLELFSRADFGHPLHTLQNVPQMRLV